MGEVLIHALGVSVEFDTYRALDGVSLEVPSGCLTAVVGANGAGKTTLLRALGGLIPEATGTLAINGFDPRITDPLTLSGVRACGPQDPSSAWDFRVTELATLSLEPDMFAHWLDRFDLSELAEHRLSQLSGGQRKAAFLSLVLSALADPFGKILLLDEPTVSLDRRRQQVVRQAVREIATAGAACLIATHDLDFARDCDRLAVLSEGRLIAHGPASSTLTPEIIRETWGSA